MVQPAPLLPPVLEGENPDNVIIVCGSNDMRKIKGVELAVVMKRDLQYLHQKLPGMQIILFSVVHRRRWRAAKPGQLNKSQEMGERCDEHIY